MMSDGVKTYLVTGGAGFIGTNFVKYLVGKYTADRMRLVVVDALTYAGNLDNIAAETALPNVRFVHGDINDSRLMDSIFESENPDYVVNFAAESHVDRSIADSRQFIITNINGTQTLLEAARRHWRDTGHERRFLQISTDEVYGSLPRDYDNPVPMRLSELLERVSRGRQNVVTYGKDLFTEQSPINPRSPYSASKASADMLVLAYGETYGLPVVITRCSNNYGPYQYPEKLIPLIISNLRQGKELPVYGRGLNVRDWLYVADHVRAVDVVLHHGRPGQVYNIGGLNERENISLVRTVIDTYAELTGTAPRHDLIRYVTDRPGHDMRYAIDPTKTASELGWVPATDFEEGIRLTVDWYLKHQSDIAL